MSSALNDRTEDAAHNGGRNDTSNQEYDNLHHSQVGGTSANVWKINKLPLKN